MKKIMIIDDDESLARVLEFNLLREGYLVLKNFTGSQAMESIEKGEIADLIILDLKLPDIDGLELMKKIKDHSDVPIIINSGYANYKSDFNSWLADDYLIKSADLGELHDRIRAALDRSLDRF